MGLSEQERERLTKMATALRTAWRSGDKSWIDLAAIALNITDIAHAEATEAQARRIAELKAKLEDAAVALHPFALEAMEWSVNTTSDVVPACGVSPTTAPAKFTVGDLRLAAQTYAALLPHDTKEPSDDR